MTVTNHTEHYGLSQYVQDGHLTYTAAVTPDATGLGTAQLDMQYSDDYNIVG